MLLTSSEIMELFDKLLEEAANYTGAQDTYLVLKGIDGVEQTVSKAFKVFGYSFGVNNIGMTQGTAGTGSSVFTNLYCVLELSKNNKNLASAFQKAAQQSDIKEATLSFYQNANEVGSIKLSAGSGTSAGVFITGFNIRRSKKKDDNKIFAIVALSYGAVDLSLDSAKGSYDLNKPSS